MAKFLSKDGKFYMRDGKLLRPTNILEVPIVATNLTYNGKVQSPTIYGYNENTMTMSGVTSGTDVGTYHITFTPKSGYEWSDGTSGAKDINWTIERATIEKVPSQSNTLTYTGSAQSPAWNGYDSTKMTIGGTTSAVNPGSYTTTFTPKDGYCWRGGTTNAESVVWSIGKAVGSLSLSTSSLTIDTNSTTGSFTVYRTGDGAISATSSAPDIATVSISGNTVIVKKVSAGTATITVSMTETAGYSGASATCTVRCRSTTGALPVGSRVYLNVDGVKQRFIVVHQGNPNTSLYDSSCTGTWLAMENSIDYRLWNSSN